MSITVSITIASSTPAHGDTVTATYAVLGNDPVPPMEGTLEGDVTVGAEVIHAVTTLTFPGTAALPESFSVPTCPGLTFTATADPKVFAALVP